MSNHIFKAFQKALRRAMRENRISQRELALVSGVNRTTINQILNDAVDNVTTSVMERLLAALDVDPRDSFLK